MMDMDIHDIRQAMHDVYGDRGEAEAMIPLFRQAFIDEGLEELYDLDTITVVDRGQGWYGLTFPKEKNDEN